MRIKNQAAVELGKLGGKKGVSNPKKARTSEQARNAALIMWEKRKNITVQVVKVERDTN